MKRKIYREDIKKAGRDLMFSKGYSATGIKDITDKVDIPKGSFYNHFSSKEEFGIELVKNYAENGANFYKRALINRKDLTPLQRFEQFFDDLIESYSENMKFKLGCFMSNFSTEMADVNENFRLELDHGFKEHEAVMIECLKEAQALGEVSADMDCELTGSFLLNSWHGALVRMKSTGNAKPLEDFKKVIFPKILN